MKPDRKIKAEKPSPKIKAVKETRRTTPKSNGKHPLVSYEHIPIGIVECSPDGKYIDVNEEFCRITGYTRSMLLRRDIKALTHEDDYAIDIKLHEQLVAGQIPFYKLEKRYVRRNGESIWVELTRSLVRDEAGKPIYTIGVVLDISERKQVERVLRESVERLRLATEAAQMFMWEWDFQNRSYTLADNFEHVIGFSSGLLSKNRFDTLENFIPAEDVQFIAEAFENAVKSRRDLPSLSCRVINPEHGEIIWLEVSAKIVYSHEGTPQRMFGVAQNVTESKKAQDEITIISRMPAENPNPVMRITPQGKVLYANDPSMVMLKSWKLQDHQIVPDDLRQHVAEAFASGLKKEIEIQQNGKTFSCVLAPIQEAGYINFYGSDITARKHAEEKMRESEERFRALVSQATAGITETDRTGCLTFANPRFAEMLGYSQSELIGKTIWEFTYLKDLEENKRLFERMMTHGESYRLEKRFVRRNGSIFWASVSVSTIRDLNGKSTGGVGVVIDIDDRKRAEDSLSEYARQQTALYELSDQLHRTNSLEDVFNAALDAILSALQCDRASILLFDNKDVMRFVAWRGLSEAYRKATDGHSPWKPDAKDPEPISMDDVRTADLGESLREIIQSEGIGSLAFIPLVFNGKLIGKFMVYFNQPHHFDNGELDLSLTIAHQLAFGVERIRAEEALARERELLERLFETMPVMVSIYDPATNLPNFNSQFEKLIGWKKEEVTLVSLMEVCYPDPEYRKQVAQRLLASAEGEWVDIQMQTRDGRTLDTTWSNMRFSNGMNVEIGIDITERKQAEERLRQAAAFDEAVMSNMGEGLYTVNAEGKVTSINPAAEKMFGWTFAELRGRKMHDVTHYKHVDGTPFPAEECAGFQVLHHGQKLVGHEDVFIRKDGTFFDVIYSSAPLWENGKINGLVVVFSDNTARKQAEKRLVLLSEISEMLRSFEDPHELMYRISTAIGEQLQVKRVLFNEIDLEHDREIVHRDYHSGLESVAGVHQVSAYSSITSAEVAAGKTVVNFDSKLDPRTAQDYEKTYAISGERSYVVVPMMRENRWVASLWVSDDKPRNWSSEEVSLLETVAERTWTVIEKLRINAELRESEERLRATLDTTVVGFATLTTETRFVEVNDAFCRIVGYSREELLGMDCSVLTHPDYLESTNQHVAQLLAGEISSFVLEKIYIRKDGVQIWVQNSVSVMQDTDGTPLSLIVICQDVTDRKRMEEALRIENERFMRFVNSNIVGILIGNTTGEVILANDYYLNLLGVSRQDFIEKKVDWKKFTPPEWLPADEKAIQELQESGICEPYEKEYVRTDGTRVPVYIADALLSGPGDEIAAFVLDISERKRAEEALRRNEQMFSTLVNAAPFGVYFIDSEFRLRSINKGAEAVFSGIDPLIGRDFAEILRIIWQEPFATEAIEHFRHTLRTGESFISTPIIEERANIDEIQAYDWQVHRITLSDGTFGVVCYFYDLSEQKRMEATVRASEALYRTIARNIPGGGVYIVDKDMRYLVAEGAVTEAFGLSREILEGHTVTEVFQGEQATRMVKRLRQNFVGATVSYETEHRGRVYWTQQAPLHESIGQAIIVTLDITERKRAEEALRQSEERFVQFMQHLPGLAWIKDRQGRYVYANAAAEKAFNTPREKLYGKTDAEIFPPEVAAQFKKNDDLALADERGIQVVEELKHEDGVPHYSLVNKFPIPGTDGSPTLIGGTAFDITERLQAEEALRESEERFRAILRQATAGIVRKDAEGRLLFVNQAFCNMLGYTEADLLGKTIWEFMHEDDVAENQRSYQRLLMEGTPFKLERRFLREDGSVIWVDTSVSPIMDVEGKPQSAVTVEVDITARKQAEEALQQLNLQLEDRVLSRTAKLRSVNQTLREEIAERKRVEEALRQSEAMARENEEKLSTLFDLLPVGISFLDLQGQIIQMNAALPNILRLAKEQVLRQEYQYRKYMRADGSPMPPIEFASARALAEARTVQNVETGILLENGQVIWTNVSAAPVDVADVGAVVVTTDITESKRAEQALQESHDRLRILSQRLVEVQEDERRALARELHDRVGQTLAALNINLIIISSQLSPELAEQIGTRLTDSMKLVAETIALVRDVMTDLRPAVLDDYGLEAAIESHLAQFIARYNIEVKLEKPHPPLPRLGPTIEMTFLRIAQEALMNIARHAHATQVNLSLRQEDGSVLMTVQDNGMGIHSWQEANRPGSHGLTIMRERAEAFSGNLNVKSVPGQGTKIEVSIPYKQAGYKESQEEKQL